MKRLISVLALSAICLTAVKAQDYDPVALGDSCLEMHDTFHALAYYTEAAARDSSAELTRKIADCHYLRGNYSLCSKTMLPVAGAGGDSLDLKRLRQMFSCSQHLGDSGGQLDWGKAILRRCPMDAGVTAQLAAIYNSETLNSPADALTLTKSYLQTDSTNIPVLRQYADSYFFLKDYAGAVDAYRRLIELGDTTYNTVYSFGLAYMQDSSFVDARRWLLKAAGMSRMENAGCLYRLGMVCMEVDSLAESVLFLSMAAEKLRPDGRVMFVIKRAEGEAYYKLGHYWNAIYSWREALRYNMNSMATMFNLAQAYGVVGKHEYEKECYRSFLSMALQAEQNETLRQWISQAEAVAGKYDGPEKVIVRPRID